MSDRSFSDYAMTGVGCGVLGALAVGTFSLITGTADVIGSTVAGWFEDEPASRAPKKKPTAKKAPKKATKRKPATRKRS